MNDYELVNYLVRTSTRSDDVSTILDYKRLNNEFLIMDCTILLNFRFDALFKKA